MSLLSDFAELVTEVANYVAAHKHKVRALFVALLALFVLAPARILVMEVLYPLAWAVDSWVSMVLAWAEGLDH